MLNIEQSIENIPHVSQQIMGKSIGLQLLALVILSVAAAAPVDDEDDNGGKHWAFLVAGSPGWVNYRHQADICHAYHIVSRNGIPDERIVVMMHDDIAHNKRNPYPGNVINQPNGTNLYPGVLKDYTGSDVKPDVFLKVLAGDSEGVEKILGRKGKVIKSGPKDRVFVYFADHGTHRALGFPGTLLHFDDFEETVLNMYRQNQYKEMVFYVEACESGSMFAPFKQLPQIKVFAMTAANPDQSSYACYFDPERETYLGDVYSVNWMQDSDKENLNQETIAEQYRITKNKTLKSQVSEYGDLKISKLPVADFQGNKNSKSLKFIPSGTAPDPMLDAVSSRDVRQEILMRRISAAKGAEREKHMAELQDLWQEKKDSEAFFKAVVATVSDATMYDHLVKKPVQFSDYPCYRESLELIMALCPGMNLPQNDFALDKLRVLANLCETEIPATKIWRAIGQVATQAKICA